LRAFWLTLFAIGARSIIKRPLFAAPESDPSAVARRLHRFLMVTAAGWLISGVLAAMAALTGEGQEWMYVAPCFLLMGALQLYVIGKSEA
jgi:hypothetical protein